MRTQDTTRGNGGSDWTPLTPGLAERFWSHVDQSGGPKACWPWTGTIQSKGYGCLGYRCADGKDRRFLAHRIAFALGTGQPLLPGLLICHRCDNRICCNPAHLFAGSNSDNVQDAIRKGRALIGEKNPAYRHGQWVGRGAKTAAGRAHYAAAAS